jgi:hypothetical protein
MMQFYGDQAHETRTGSQARELADLLKENPPDDRGDCDTAHK